MPEHILCLDIGSGTQDVLLYSTGEELENCPKFILPSPARAVSARIRELTEAGRPIYLYGRNMGGGFYFSLRKHLEKGLPVAAQPSAAYSLADDLTRVEKMGIVLSESCPAGYVPVQLSDFDFGYWRGFLSMAGLPLPDRIAACAQDHGFHPGESNRAGRFKLWRQFLEAGKGELAALVYENVPEQLTRLKDLQASIGGGIVCDTGAAAMLGALFEPEIEERGRREGLCLVNVGNSHVIAFLLFRDKVYGVYEQHTGVVDAGKLWDDLAQFRKGELTFEQVFAENGHGCMTLDLPAEAKGFLPAYVIGPKRGMLKGYDAEFIAPGGDMMLAGSFGLLKGLSLKGIL